CSRVSVKSRRGVRGLGCRGWLVHGGYLSQTAQGIPVPQVQPSGRRVLMGSGEGSGITGGAQYTGSLSVCSGCRCGLQRLQGQGRSGGRGEGPSYRGMMKTSTVLKATGRKEALAAPFYWAPFILSGDSRPIEQ